MYDQFLYLAFSALNISHYIALHRLYCFYLHILQVNNMVREMIVSVLYRVFVFVYSTTKNNIFLSLYKSLLLGFTSACNNNILWGLGNKFAFAATISVIAFYCTAADFTFSFSFHSIFFSFLFLVLSVLLLSFLLRPPVSPDLISSDPGFNLHQPTFFSTSVAGQNVNGTRTEYET